MAANSQARDRSSTYTWAERRKGGSFDQFTTHVQHHQIPVRGIGKLYGTKPDILRRQKLGIRVHSFRNQPLSLRFQTRAVDQIISEIQANIQLPNIAVDILGNNVTLFGGSISGGLVRGAPAGQIDIQINSPVGVTEITRPGFSVPR